MAIQFIRAVVDSARRQGFDLGEALRDAELSEELVGRDATRVTPAQASRIIQALWNVTDDELMGVGPKTVPRGTFQMMTLSLVHVADLATALQRLVEFTRIATGFDAIDMVVDGSTTRLSFDLGSTPGQGNHLVIDIMMTVVHRFAGWLIGQRIELISVALPWPAPAHATEYPLIYGVVPQFDAAGAAMVLPSRYLSAPVIRSEGDLLQFIRRSPEGLLFQRDFTPTTASRVRRIIERQSPQDPVTVEGIAQRLTVSGQHLRRLLREEGTSVRQIREEALRDEAITSLVRGRETVEELSDRLGFSEPSAFRRAFRRWTGSPPGAYGSALRGHGAAGGAVRSSVTDRAR